MDPLSALSVAGTIVTFVDFGCRLLRNGRELYKSVNGTLGANIELELITLDLQSVLSKLRNSANNSSQSVVSGPATQAPKDEISFQEVCDGAAKIAEELLERLETLKVKGEKFKRFLSLQKALHNLWSNQEITELTNRLKGFREALNTRIILSMRESINEQRLAISAFYGHVDKQSQLIISSIVEKMSGSAEDHANKFMHTLAQLLQRVENSNQAEHLQTRKIILQQLQEFEHSQSYSDQTEGEDLVVTFEMLGVESSEELALRRKAEDIVITSLQYEKMTHRYEDILEAYAETFEWIFTHDPQTPGNSSYNFASWLRGENGGIFWISGKAGSGKSTLMKHIFDDKRTRHHLKQWAKDVPLYQASFFFWNSGSKEQKSLAGCLKALLFQIFNAHPNLVPVILPERWADSYSSCATRSTHSSPPWTLKELCITFKALIRQKKIPVALNFLIDGLDEFDGDHEEMVELFQESANLPNVKTCLSTRPWVLFKDAFCDYPQLRLQDLTANDIHHFVQDRFHKNQAFQRLTNLEPASASQLTLDVVERAGGVFLWVRLVVRSLLDGLRNHDSIAILQHRLELIPRELDDLYTHLLGLINPVYMYWTSRAFQILRASRELENNPFGLYIPRTSRELENNTPGPTPVGSGEGVISLTIDAFSLAMEENFEFKNSPLMTPDVVDKAYEWTEVHLTARCAGLLEVSRSSHRGSRGSSIDYFHRTARDYLENGSSWSNILKHTASTKFNPYSTLLRVYAGIVSMEPTFGNIAYFQGLHLSSKYGAGYNIRIPHERLILSAFIYAYKCEKLGIFSAEDTKSLDALNQGMLKRFMGQTHWANELSLNDLPQTGANELAKFESFLDLAAIYQLAEYIQQMLLLQPEAMSPERATSLLLLCLAFRKNDTTTAVTVPQANPKLISLLLSHGAKASSINTAWGNALRLIYLLDAAPRAILLDLLEVAFLLLRAGANAKSVLKIRKGEPISAWRIFAMLQKDFPEAVRKIQDEMLRLAPDLDQVFDVRDATMPRELL